ncbi:septum formation initiator family protein [Thermatribacter velox]|uniref:Septum formation initiator family protein n=1 Tax=Thermatribacter velox TaxID=3039681 RepID=A0ABZ2YCU6_9BACT
MLWINQFLEKMVIYWKTCERIEQFIREEERLQQEIAAMKKEKEYLHQDWYIEKLARERLNLVKPGEIVVELVPSQNP